jgi:hypothetical protein
MFQRRCELKPEIKSGGFMKNCLRVSFIATAALVAHAAVFAHEPTASTKTTQRTQVTPGNHKVGTVPSVYKRGMLRTTKTNMGVRVFYEFVGTGVDSAGLLTLKIMRLGGGEPATLELRPDAAISLPTGLPATPAPFNSGAEYVVKVKPTADGLHYINVFLQSGTVTEAMAIPVQIGKNANLSKPGNVSVMPDGQRVISVPAQ